MNKDDHPKIKLNYSGPMTPDVAAYLEQVEQVMNERVDVPKLVAASNEAAAALQAFGSAEMNPSDFIRAAKTALANNEPDGPFLPVLLPFEVAKFEQDGKVRGRDYIVIKCLKCMNDMDRCTCPPEPDEEAD